MSWFAGVVCTVIIGALIWFSLPLVPMLADFVGETLRSLTA
jgi:hypothetical protein